MKKLLFCILLLNFPSVYCQTSNDSDKRIWGTTGFVAYNSPSSRDGFGFNISVDYLKNKNYWKLRYIHVNEFNYSWLGKTVPIEKFYDIGFLYGRVTKTKIIRLSASGGLGVLGGVRRGEFLSNTGYDYYYKEEHIFTPAIPLEVDLSLIPFEYLGVGISGFANLNLKNSIVGFIIKLEIGKIR